MGNYADHSGDIETENRTKNGDSITGAFDWRNSAFHVYNSYLTEDLFSNIAFVFLITVISLALNKMYQCQKGSAFIVTYYVWIGLALMDFFVQTLAYMSLRDLQISGVSILMYRVYLCFLRKVIPGKTAFPK
ncbi:MAG: hypothetical protein HFI39_12735 [Lachnospiraceae bacterium]|nr:hypothetical protein [Lachnospiraceae bacterium]